MANIPTYGDPQVDPRPLPTPFDPNRATPDSFGAPIGEGVGRLAHAAAEIGLRAKQEADAAAVIGAVGDGQKAFNDVILDGYLSTRGHDALEKRDDALGAYKQALDSAQSSLSPDQKRIFAREHQRLWEQGVERVVHHEGTQVEAASAANFRGSADQTLRTMQATAIVTNPDALQAQIDGLDGISRGEALRRFGVHASNEEIQSVVGPEMQKGALAAMNGAMATENAGVAAATYQRVGQYLGEHEHTYGNFVRAMATKQQIGSQSLALVLGATQKVAMPDGTEVPRVDGTKLAAAVAKLPPDTANLAEIQKAADQREKILGDVWSKSVATVTARVHTAGQDPATGDFSLQSPGIAAKDKAWLNQFAPGELTKLRALDVRGQKADRDEMVAASAANYSVLTADMQNTAKWASAYSQMSPEQFRSYLLSSQFPGGFVPADMRRAQAEFHKMQNTKLEESVGRTIKEEIARVYPGDNMAEQRKDFGDTWTGRLLDRANAFVASEKAAGRKTSSEDVRKFVASQMATVPNGKWFTPDQRRIELDPASALLPPPVAAATPVPAGRVTVRNAAGKAFTLPAEQVDAFLKSDAGKGYSR